MSDQTIIVRGNGTIFLGGPPLVKAATGEEISAQDLGGADVHSRLSGVTDYVADSEREACELCREIIRHCNLKPSAARSEQAVEAPLFDCAEIAGIIPKDSKKSFDVRELIARIVDGSRFLEFKKEYGPTMVTGFASLYNMPLGIVANNGILFSESTLKAVHFIELCSQRKLPILFLQNITGFMIGSEYERQGIAKHGCRLPDFPCRREARQRRLHHAVSEDHSHRWRQLRRGELRHGRARVLPAVSVHVSEQPHFGDGRNAGGDGAEHCEARRDRAARWGCGQSASVGGTWSAEEEEAFKKPILEKYDRESRYLFSTARLWDDGVIPYADTRRVLGLSLAAVHNREIGDTEFGLFRM